MLGNKNDNSQKSDKNEVSQLQPVSDIQINTSHFIYDKSKE
jgi:hypothetical protein